MADSHPADLDAERQAERPATTNSRGDGWRRFFFDPDPAANEHFARVDAALAAAEHRLPRRARAWSVLAGIVLSWLLVVLLAWLIWAPDGKNSRAQRPAFSAPAASPRQG